MSLNQIFERFRGDESASVRAHTFVPIEYVDAINELLRVAWHGGENISIPVSKDGRNPMTYKGASGQMLRSMLKYILSILTQHEGWSIFITERFSHESTDKILAVFGSAPVSIVGTEANFDDCAASINLKRIFRDIFQTDLSWRELLIQTIITLKGKSDEGSVVEAVALPWFAILKEIEKDPLFLSHFAQQPRKFEEFLAGAYERAGWPEVIITPRSNDKGRDIIASKPGFGSIRILDQAKAYSLGRFVSHDDVRAMLGVLATDPNASKGVITTTSDFQPGVLSSQEFSRFMPYRLELKNGQQLRSWLAEIKEKSRS